MYQKNALKKILLIGEEGKTDYVLIKDFNSFMYDHCGRKHIYRYCLQYFSTEEILKFHMKDCFNINVIGRIIMSKKAEYVNFKNYF